MTAADRLKATSTLGDLARGIVESGREAVSAASAPSQASSARREGPFGEGDIDRLIPDKTELWRDIFLTPKAYRRAGRADALANTIGIRSPDSVASPKANRIVSTVLGGLGGGLAGGGLGLALSYALEGHVNPGAMAGGAGLGAALGTLGGFAHDVSSRREAEAAIKREAITAVARGEKPSSAIQRGSILASLVSGVHQQGRADTVDSIANGRTSFEDNPVMSGLQAARYFPGLQPVAGPLSMIGSFGNYEQAQDRIDQARPQATRVIQ